MASILNEHGWHEFLCKSHFSFLTAPSEPYHLVRTAAGHGYRSLALNDFDGVYGVARFHLGHQTLEQELKAELPPLHLIQGAEIHLQPDHHLPISSQDTLALLARDMEGYRQLCSLLTLTHRQGKSGAHISLEELASHDCSGLIAIQPMRGVMRLTCPDAASRIEERLAACSLIFPGRFHLAVSRYLHPAEDTWIPRTLAAAARHQLPCLLSKDAFFHDQAMKPMCDLLQAIRLNLSLDAAVGHMFPNCERYLRPLAALEKLYGCLPVFGAALKNARELQASLDFSLSMLKYRYPREMIPAGESSQGYLEKITWEGAAKRYPGALPGLVRSELAKELKLFDELQFADYFLTVWDIVRWAREQGILCQGRGSAANSSVCYVLGITSINPENFDLLFERFISMERGDPPDIDVDFEHERREEVIHYIYSRYGRARAAMVANVIRFRGRGAVRAVGKALGVPAVTVDAVAKGLKSKIHRGSTMEGRTVVQWCKDDIEGLGLFKIDILALGMLTALRKAFELLREHSGISLDIAKVQKEKGEDAETSKMIQRADTVGTFQIESRAQMSMLPRLKPANFYDLVIEVAIIRPGPIQGGMIQPYLRRRENRKPWITRTSGCGPC